MAHLRIPRKNRPVGCDLSHFRAPLFEPFPDTVGSDIRAGQEKRPPLDKIPAGKLLDEFGRRKLSRNEIRPSPPPDQRVPGRGPDGRHANAVQKSHMPFERFKTPRDRPDTIGAGKDNPLKPENVF